MDWHWLWWIVAALVFALLEVVTLSFVLLMFAGGAVAAGIVALAGGSAWWQVVAFALVSTVLLLTARRALLERFRDRTPKHLTNADALVGREALVLDAVTGTGGRVKLGGEVWTARTASGARPEPLSAGEPVRVVRIDGATAVVEPLHLTPGGPKE
ncbi:NfeD family protein [Luteimicrobium subarcticum]|uniref:Membrane protein implicated in regulation of membrane protease activity n=1 Tax=Luteimicrobium subarcticum TaxID=620910 RepID=A0A2M8WWE8_9MICO|nr:NfeD family protein [Luteimicrobium subarcticum]PJI95245.1 membrane protein implicated in regulation of membrane protease activity [Luteimicrobium subarcticum]